MSAMRRFNASSKTMYTDAHCHVHEYREEEIERFGGAFKVIVAVSDDLESSGRTLKLAERYGFLVPCVGVHPWELKGHDPEALAGELEKLVRKSGARCLGEVGVDLAFVPETFDKQLEFFRRILDLARDCDMAVNVHAAKAWRQALDEVVKKGVRRVLFHWYNGPLDILGEIAARGYLISINPTVKISSKHLEIARRAPLDVITFESDGPYEYRGLSLSPWMIPETVNLVASSRDMDVSELIEISNENLIRYLQLED